MNARSLINARIGEYRIVEFLGEGGMGEVYRAEHEKIGRIVAVKLLTQVRNNGRFLQRSRNEARIQARLQHRNIAALYDFLEYQSMPCLIMEYVDGKTLEERLQERGALAPRETTRVFADVVRAIAYIHAQGIVHRDIKPENIKITRAGEVKLLDFGIASTGDSPKLTVTGNVVGTTHYLSPERIRGKPADVRTDIWALGVLLYELLTGEMPFDVPGAQSPVQLYDKILNGSYEPASARNRRVPPSLDGIIDKCLAKRPGARFSSAMALLDALGEDAPSPAPRPVSSPGLAGRVERAGKLVRSKPEVLLLSGALLVAALLFGDALTDSSGRGSDQAGRSIRVVTPSADTTFRATGPAEGSSIESKTLIDPKLSSVKHANSAQTPSRKPAVRLVQPQVATLNPGSSSRRASIPVRIGLVFGKADLFLDGVWIKRLGSTEPHVFYAEEGQRFNMVLRSDGYQEITRNITVVGSENEYHFKMDRKAGASR